MDAATIKAIMSEVAGVVREYVASETAPLVERCAALESDNETLADINAALVARLDAVEACIPAAVASETSLLAVRAEQIEVRAGTLECDIADLRPLAAQVEAMAGANEQRDARIAELEARAMPDVSSFCDAEAVRLIVGERGAEIIVPEPSAEFAAEVAAMAEANVERDARLAALEAREIPEAIKGDPGDPGEKGERGEKGDPGEVDMAAVQALVAEAVAALPLPEKGEPGEKGDPGQDGLPGRDGTDGKDGLGLANALKDNEGSLILTMTDGSTRNLGRIDGKDGETFTLDDFDIELLDERSIKLKFTKGDVCHSFELEFPVPIYRGVFKEGETYARGDMVTWAGSLWHCDEPKGMKPGEPESGFALAAKKGRDGKDFKAAA